MKARGRVSAWLDRHLLRITVAVMVAAFFFLLFADRMIVIIPAGQCGVLWKRFAGGTQVASTRSGQAVACGRDVQPYLQPGAQADPTFGEGFRLILPWDSMTLYNLRYQTVDRDFVAVDSGGLRLDIKVTTRFKLNPAHVATLHQRVGPDYVDVMIVPDVGAYTRRIVAQYTAEQVYGEQRQVVQNFILRAMEEAQEQIYHNLIDVTDVLLRDVILPPIVATAIEEKVRQFHMDKEWDFRLLREQKESRRKAIEAEGIQRFQETVNRGISEQYLRWKGIDATLKLAESPNTKIVIIGSGPQGLPIILGNEPSGPAPAGPSPAPPRADAPVESQPARPAQDATSSTPGPARTEAAPRPPMSGSSRPAPASPDPDRARAEPGPAAPSAGGIGGLLDRLLGLGR